MHNNLTKSCYERGAPTITLLTHNNTTRFRRSRHLHHSLPHHRTTCRMLKKWEYHLIDQVHTRSDKPQYKKKYKMYNTIFSIRKLTGIL